MSRSAEQKRIHYVRATYNQGTAPGKSFQWHVEEALKVLPKHKDTEVLLPTTELLSVRHRHTAPNEPVRLAIGLGVPNEAMSTVGVDQDTAADVDKASRPPNGRAFKLADAFCLIDENDLLICMDGSIRLNKVEGYLRGLLKAAGRASPAQAFELVARMNQDKAQTLSEEGIKAFRIKATAYAASATLSNGQNGAFTTGWKKFLAGIRSVFEAEVDGQNEKDALAQHWADLNIITTIAVGGGMRGEPVVLESLEGAAKEIQNQAPPGAEVTLVTGKGNEVGVDSLTLKTQKSIKRINGQNALDYTDAWRKMLTYRQELIDSKRWKK